MIKVVETPVQLEKENEHTYIANIEKKIYVFGIKIYHSSKVRRV